MDALLKHTLLISLIGFFLVGSISQLSFGHGLPMEILPPENLGDRKVTLRAAVFPIPDPEINGQQLEFDLTDSNTGEPINAVTYLLKVLKKDQVLFEYTFQEPDGVLIIDLIPTESNQITVEADVSVSTFETIIGVQKKSVAKGAPFKDGGLYKFEIQVLTAESYSNKLNDPIKYNLGLSLPELSNHNFDDPDFGNQQLEFIAYYDQIINFNYDLGSKSLSFELPFDWSEGNIEQSSVVHNEILIPKTYTNLMVSDFSVYVNDLKLPANSIQIDDFSAEKRLVHLIINQFDLNELFQKQSNPKDTMEFLVKPAENSWLVGTVTNNGQFRVTLDTDPHTIESGSKVTLYFDILDVFLKNKPISVMYDLSIFHDGEVIFRTSGKSSDSREEHDKIEFIVPEHVMGPILVKFENLDDNELSKLQIPIIVNQKTQNVLTNQFENTSIPAWIRNNAGWWSQGSIDDSDFVMGIQYLIKEKIMQIPETIQMDSSLESTEIPSWIKNNADWWSRGLISDNDFVKGIQYMIEHGIIKV